MVLPLVKALQNDPPCPLSNHDRGCIQSCEDIRERLNHRLFFLDPEACWGWYSVSLAACTKVDLSRIDIYGSKVIRYHNIEKIVQLSCINCGGDLWISCGIKGFRGGNLAERLGMVPDFEHRGRDMIQRTVFLDEHLEMLLEGLSKARLLLEG
jgi:hypothetical protein